MLMERLVDILFGTIFFAVPIIGMILSWCIKKTRPHETNRRITVHREKEVAKSIQNGEYVFKQTPILIEPLPKESLHYLSSIPLDTS